MEFDAAGSGFDPSATFGPSTSFGRGRGADNSFGDREAPIVISTSPAPLGARRRLVGGLTSAMMRRSSGGAGDLGGKASFAAIIRLRCDAGAKLGISAVSG